LNKRAVLRRLIAWKTQSVIYAKICLKEIQK
jgi:hypothetical protein